MICGHCAKPTPGAFVCPCAKGSDPHVICTACGNEPDNITIANAAWLSPLSRSRIAHTSKTLADVVFLTAPWGHA